MRYPNTLRRHREAKGIGQWDVARAVDIHLNRYGRMERGEAEPSYLEGVRLARFFRVSPTALFPAPAKTAAA